ncbi:MAG: calcium/sodium antiporter [Verrucomicrobiota bacterium]
MVGDITLLIAGLLLLFFGAEALVRGATAVSLRAGIPPLIVGLTVLAFCTSSPELVVGLKAALNNNGGICLGNVIGSNIANTGLILGIAAMILPLGVNRQIVRREIPVMLGLTFLFVYFMLGESIGRVEGALLFVGLITYIIYSVITARKSGETATQEEVESVAPNLGRHWSIDALLLIGGLGILLLGAELMVTSAVNIATTLGAPEVLIGLTMVAIGTSLPELATSIVAAVKKQCDLMVGNLIGSNIFNLGAILGSASLVRPIVNEGVTMVDIVILLIFSMALVPIMLSNYKISRLEGALLVIGYLGYMAYIGVQLA